jgi:hypothetical protein
MNVSSSVIDVLPAEVDDRSVWYGAEMARSEDWVEWLSEAQTDEIESVVRTLHESKADTRAITAEDVSLPMLGPRLRGMLDEVMNGRGLC